MAQCYVQSLEQDLADCQELIASYEMRLRAHADLVKMQAATAEIRESKMGALERTLELLETELHKLRMLKGRA